MHTQSIFSIPGNRCLCFLLLALASMTTSSAAQDNTFSGTYTLVFGSRDRLLHPAKHVRPGGRLLSQRSAAAASLRLFVYSETGQDVLTGTLVADGNGNIITGSSYVLTADLNSIQVLVTSTIQRPIVPTKFRLETPGAAQPATSSVTKPTSPDGGNTAHLPGCDQ